MTTVATAHTTGNTKGAPTYNDLFIDAINYGTVRNTHPKEIMVGDVCAPQCNEGYTTVQLPGSASRKGTASLCIKVNTGAGGNLLPLHVFHHLYPNQISPAGLPTGLDHDMIWHQMRHGIFYHLYFQLYFTAFRYKLYTITLSLLKILYIYLQCYPFYRNYKEVFISFKVFIVRPA